MKKFYFEINIIINWILGMLMNIICDIGFMVLGIFSSNARRTYIERFYPQIKISYRRKNICTRVNDSNVKKGKL